MNAPTVARPTVRTPDRRTIKRASFELYVDQIETLRRLDLEERLSGGKGSQSEMVSEALDRYLAERQGGK